MKLSKKDIKEFYKDGTQKGELTPVIYKNGKIYIPTNKGLIVKKVAR